MKITPAIPQFPVKKLYQDWAVKSGSAQKIVQALEEHVPEFQKNISILSTDTVNWLRKVDRIDDKSGKITQIFDSNDVERVRALWRDNGKIKELLVRDEQGKVGSLALDSGKDLFYTFNIRG